MAAHHHQQDGQQPGDRQVVARAALAAGARDDAGGMGVHVLGDAVGVDDRDQPVQQDDDVEHEDRAQHERVEDEPEQLDPVEPDRDPAAEGDEQDGCGREGERPRRRAGIQLAKPGEDQREEGGGKRRPRTRSRPLRFVHRG